MGKRYFDKNLGIWRTSGRPLSRSLYAQYVKPVPIHIRPAAVNSRGYIRARSPYTHNTWRRNVRKAAYGLGTAFNFLSHFL